MFLTLTIEDIIFTLASQGSLLVIGDRVYNVATGVVVRNESGLTISMSDLELGDIVGGNVVDTGPGIWTISELWRLDDEFDLSEF